MRAVEPFRNPEQPEQYQTEGESPERPRIHHPVPEGSPVSSLLEQLPMPWDIFRKTGPGDDCRDFFLAASGGKGRSAGPDAGEKPGKTIDRMDYGLSPEVLLSHIQKVLTTGEEVCFSGEYVAGSDEPVRICRKILLLDPEHIAVIADEGAARRRVEKRLSAAEEKFRLLASQIPDHVFFQDAELRYVWSNNGPFGLSAEEMLGRHDREVYSSQDAEEMTRLKEQVLKDRTSRSFRLTLTSRNEKNEYFEGTFLPVEAEDRENRGILGYLRNITSWVKSEQALQQNELLNRQLLNTIPDPVWLKSTDGIYISCNHSFEQFYGAPESEIIGKTDYDFTTPELADFFLKNDRLAIEAGVSRKNEEWLTFRGTGYRGLFETIKTPVKDLSGRTIGIMGIARDITQRKLSEEALRENERRYAQAQSIGKVGNWEFILADERFWLSEESKILFGLEASRSYFTVEELSPLFINWDRAVRALDHLRNSGESYEMEMDIRPADGEEIRVFKTIAELILDESGEPLKISGVIQDVTQQRQFEADKQKLERQLRQSQKLESIGQLAGGIAHDFNNILAAVLGYTEMSLEEVEKNSRLERLLREVLMSGNRAKELVKQILTFARQTEEEKIAVRTDLLAMEALNMLRSLLPSTIEIRRNFRSRAYVLGNPTQIHQIFMNLCTNAAQAIGEEPGVIAVHLEDADFLPEDPEKPEGLAAGKYLRIRVEDSGRGIDSSILESIFDPYFTTKAPGEGSGMGLAVVHGIALGYGGTITVRSAPGKGAVFDVFLPRTEEDSTDRKNSIQAVPGGRETILFVDDEISIAGLTGEMLTKLGYRVYTRTNSLEALEFFRENRGIIDLVISDIAMPHLSGDRLAREIWDLSPGMPVILCTGYNNRISPEKALQMGARALIQKPILKAQLAQLVRSVLDGEPPDEQNFHSGRTP